MCKEKENGELKSESESENLQEDGFDLIDQIEKDTAEKREETIIRCCLEDQLRTLI
jgi:hypothetical protein